MKKDSIQTSLFKPKKESNLVSIEKYKEMCETKHKRKQHEKKYMADIMKLARSLNLPCIHIEHFCGNKFFPTCSGSKKRPHKETKLICPICHRPVIATCVNRINKNLAGHFDILGISWAIETKHKKNILISSPSWKGLHRMRTRDYPSPRTSNT